MRHHGFSCSSLYTVTPEQAQGNLLIEFHEQARAIAVEQGDRGLETKALVNIGLSYFELGDFPKAIRLSKEGLFIAREIADWRNEAAALGNIGIAYRRRSISSAL